MKLFSENTFKKKTENWIQKFIIFNISLKVKTPCHVVIITNLASSLIPNLLDPSFLYLFLLQPSSPKTTTCLQTPSSMHQMATTHTSKHHTITQTTILSCPPQPLAQTPATQQSPPSKHRAPPPIATATQPSVILFPFGYVSWCPNLIVGAKVRPDKGGGSTT